MICNILQVVFGFAHSFFLGLVSDSITYLFFAFVVE